MKHLIIVGVWLSDVFSCNDSSRGFCIIEAIDNCLRRSILASTSSKSDWNGGPVHVKDEINRLVPFVPIPNWHFDVRIIIHIETETTEMIIHD